MPKPKIVSDYLDAAVPKGLAASRRKLLTEELESHIYDKAEHYMEIGYGEEESFEKAVAEMGDAEEVGDSFRKLYHESGAVNVLLAVLLVGINAVASYYNLGGNIAQSMTDPNFMIVLLSLGYYSAVVLLIKVAYGKKQTNRLAAVGASMLIVSIPSFFIGTVFVPGGYAVLSNLLFLAEKVTGANCIHLFDNHFDVLYFLFSDLTPLALCVTAFVLLLKSNCYESQKRFRLSSFGPKTTAVLLVLFTLGSAVVYPFARNYEDARCVTEYEKIPISDILRATYTDIRIGDNKSDVLPLIRKAGLVSSNTFLKLLNEHYADFITEKAKAEISKQLQGKQNALMFLPKTDKYGGTPEEAEAFILVEFDENSKVCGKEVSLSTWTGGEDDPDSLALYSKRLRVGMTKEQAAEILSAPACEKVLESISYHGNTVTETESYYALEEKYNKTVFGVPVPYDLGGRSHFEAFRVTLVFENGVLKEPPETKKTDDVYTEKMSDYPE